MKMTMVLELSDEYYKDSDVPVIFRNLKTAVGFKGVEVKSITKVSDEVEYPKPKWRDNPYVDERKEYLS